MDFAAEMDWPGYFEAVANKPARETLVKALELFEKEVAAKPRRAGAGGGAKPRELAAVDIGCGEGRDTRELLSRAGPVRWSVMAADGSGKGLAILEASIKRGDRGRVLISQCVMEDLPRAYAGGVRVGGRARVLRRVDLVNASFSLPFCKPAALPKVWVWIDGLIRPGGRFAGQVFGDRDTWAYARKTTGIPRKRLDEMFRGFVFEELREEEKDDRTTMGELKHWHVYHIVARKR